MRKTKKTPNEVRKGNLPNTKGRIVNVLAHSLGEAVGTVTYRIHAISKLPLNPIERKCLFISFVKYMQHNTIN